MNDERVAVSAADAYLARLTANGDFSGAVLLGRAGHALFKQGYGLCNIEQARPNTPQTPFQIGSITKQFTALAIMLLHEQGRLQLHDSLTLHLAGCHSAWRSVTIHHLLTHTSGIPDLRFWPPMFEPARPGPITPAYLAELFAERPLEAAPGARYVYSNWGYILLGALIEQLSGLPYATFLQQRIFEPLGMTSSGYTDRRAVLPGRAAGYALVDGVLRNASFLDLEDSYAAGALYSTVEDLLRWDQALYSERLVSRAALTRIFTPHVAVGDGSHYGYGWQIAARAGRPVLYHGGRIDGFRVLYERYPEQQVCLIVLGNRASVVPGSIAAELAALLFADNM